MTEFYYAIDVQVDHFIGCGHYDRTVFRTIELSLSDGTKEINEIYFETNKETLIKNAIWMYNNTHKAKIAKVTQIRKAPIMEIKNELNP